MDAQHAGVATNGGSAQKHQGGGAGGNTPTLNGEPNEDGEGNNNGDA